MSSIGEENKVLRYSPPVPPQTLFFSSNQHIPFTMSFGGGFGGGASVRGFGCTKPASALRSLTSPCPIRLRTRLPRKCPSISTPTQSFTPALPAQGGFIAPDAQAQASQQPAAGRAPGGGSRQSTVTPVTAQTIAGATSDGGACAAAFSGSLGLQSGVGPSVPRHRPRWFAGRDQRGRGGGGWRDAA